VWHQLEPAAAALGAAALGVVEFWSPELWGGEEHTVGVIFTNPHLCVHKFCSLCVCSMFL